MASPDDFVPVAAVSRNGLDESVHFGAVVVLDRDGTAVAGAGCSSAIVYPRSANKPMQAVAMIRSGLRVASEELALVCASHDGTARHLAVVESVLSHVGLSATDLATTPGLPLDTRAATATIRDGGSATPLAMNCSGKHAGMLATCVARGWPTDASYLDLGHPLQVVIGETIAGLIEEPVAHVGVDGCGAPAHAFSLVGLARAFRTIAIGAAGSAGDEVYRAMTTHPELVGGEGRDVTALMRAVPGLMAKDGADGVFAAALPDGRAVALKIADGGDRARIPVMLAALERAGVSTAQYPTAQMPVVLGHGRVVGAVRSVW